MNSLPEIGEKIVVYGMLQEAKVASVCWDTTSFDWIINLDWGFHGQSKVRLHDENKTWYRFSKVN
jgi:hypothetical protein